MKELVQGMWSAALSEYLFLGGVTGVFSPSSHSLFLCSS